MTVNVREMRWWDIEMVAQLEASLFTDDAWPDSMFWSELAQRETRTYLVAEDGDRLVGYAGLCAYARREAYVQTIAVEQTTQRRGVGTMLLQRLLADAAARGCDHVDLEVRSDNAGAIAMYERFGFLSVGVRKLYYQPSGTDALVMRRRNAS